MPCNDSGLLDSALHSQFGLVDIDWSNGKQIWVNPPMNDEELMVTQVAILKEWNPNIKVFVYRNLVKALPWFTSIRNKISDPTYSEWFLKFKPGGFFPNGSYHVPQCDNNYNPPKCTDFYHDQEQTPEYPSGDGNCPGPCDCGVVPCGEYLYDHVNGGEALQQWIINDFVLGPTGLGNSNVSGFYFDDGWTNSSGGFSNACSNSPIGGATEEDYYCAADIGFTQENTTAMKEAWQSTMAAVQDAVVAAGGWAWQYFRSFSTPDNSTCAAQLRQICKEGDQSPYYTSALVHQFARNANGSPVPLPSFNQDLATFLLIRGPYAWLGYGWVGCNIEYEFPAALKADYGVPLGTCSETGPGTGVFTRSYTNAKAQMDCNTWTGSVTMA